MATRGTAAWQRSRVRLATISSVFAVACLLGSGVAIAGGLVAPVRPSHAAGRSWRAPMTQMPGDARVPQLVPLQATDATTGVNAGSHASTYLLARLRFEPRAYEARPRP